MFSHPRCYASKRGDCSTKISGEHAISANVLHVFGDDGLIDLGGLTFLADDQRRNLPIASLGSNILCDRHNSGLSHLDAVGGDVVRRIVDVHTTLRTIKRRRPIPEADFDGVEFERWLLKCLCGLVVSGLAESKADTDRVWRPPEQWLRILFGEEPFPDRWGLYMLGKVGERLDIVPRLQFALVGNPQTGPTALRAGWIDKVFALVMIDPPDRPDSIVAGAPYRPWTFLDSNDLNDAVTTFHWPGEPGATVTVAHENPRKVDRRLPRES